MWEIFLLEKVQKASKIYSRKKYIMRSSDHKRGPGRGILFYKGGYNTKNAYPIWIIVKYNCLPVTLLKPKIALGNKLICCRKSECTELFIDALTNRGIAGSTLTFGETKHHANIPRLG